MSGSVNDAPHAAAPCPSESSRLNLSAISDLDTSVLSLFKSSALHVTQLYKESLECNKKAYLKGYLQSLQDTWEVLTNCYQMQGQAEVLSGRESHSQSQSQQIYNSLAHFLQQKRAQVVEHQNSLQRGAQVSSSPPHAMGHSGMPVHGSSSAELSSIGQVTHSVASLQQQQQRQHSDLRTSAASNGSSIPADKSPVSQHSATHLAEEPYKQRSVKRRFSEREYNDQQGPFPPIPPYSAHRGHDS